MLFLLSSPAPLHYRAGLKEKEVAPKFKTAHCFSGKTTRKSVIPLQKIVTRYERGSHPDWQRNVFEYHELFEIEPFEEHWLNV